MCASLYFSATERQVQEIVVNAARGAIPVGGNVFYHEPMLCLDPASILFLSTGDLFIETIRGRMIHIRFDRLGDCKWRVEETFPLITHQSWARKYRTWHDLLTSVPGVQIDGNSHRAASEDSIRWLR